jgi:hypothetical protein
MAGFGDGINRRGNGPLPPSYAANLTIVPDWVDGAQTQLGIEPDSAMRGQPAPLAWWQRRPRLGPETTPQPVPVWLQSRPYSRGAQAYSPQFGVLPYNPIGAGIFAPYRIPTIAGPGARYQYAAIWFDVQSIPTSIVINPTIPIATMDALIATARVGPSYRTTG